MGKKVDVIEIKIPKTLKTEFFAKIKREYGDTTTDIINNVILDIFENWLIQTDMDENLEHSTQPDLDAHNTENEEEDVFCDPMGVFPGNPDNPGVFNPDEGFFPVEWNGSHQLNIMRAKAQVSFMLPAELYPVLGRRLMNEILSVVENKQKTGFVEVRKL